MSQSFTRRPRNVEVVLQYLANADLSKRHSPAFRTEMLEEINRSIEGVPMKRDYMIMFVNEICETAKTDEWRDLRLNSFGVPLKYQNKETDSRFREVLDCTIPKIKEQVEFEAPRKRRSPIRYRYRVTPSVFHPSNVTTINLTANGYGSTSNDQEDHEEDEKEDEDDDSFDLDEVEEEERKARKRARTSSGSTSSDGTSMKKTREVLTNFLRSFANYLNSQATMIERELAEST